MCATMAEKHSYQIHTDLQPGTIFIALNCLNQPNLRDNRKVMQISIMVISGTAKPRREYPLLHICNWLRNKTQECLLSDLYHRTVTPSSQNR